MSVDMFERRFRQEVQKLPLFAPNDQRDPRVWPKKGSKDAEFPAWHALFSAMCLFGHSTGYRLFSYEQFFRYCMHAYVESHPEHERFERYFEGDLLAGMRQRISVWYESGMAVHICTPAWRKPSKTRPRPGWCSTTPARTGS